MRIWLVELIVVVSLAVAGPPSGSVPSHGNLQANAGPASTGREVDLLDLTTRTGSLARAGIEVCIPPGHVTDDPPPFGTVMDTWELRMSGSYAGAGITWRRDSGRFYLVDQAYVGQPAVWSLDPADPHGTFRRENWVLPNMGSDTVDIPWSIAWDGDSGCFWISDIVDRNIFGGCYYIRIRKTAVGDTWRWFSENPGDTWLVSGGAGSMYWMAGSDKDHGRGYFACAPVAPTGPNNFVWKFDPYTKTGLGRCAYGDTISERGCSLVPYDSNYLLTAGWTASNYLHKRDSTGLPLERAQGIDIADIAVWVPRVIGPDDTVFMYAIVNDPHNELQKRSVGLLWGQLPSVHPFNVRPLSILAPSGTVDSGRTVTPRLVIRNAGTAPADGVNACFTIDVNGTPMYADSITGLSLAAGVSETLAFAGWTSQGRDTMSAIAWTCWSGDSFPEDDTIRNRFLVRIQDIAVTGITTPAPDTVVDSGAVFAPQCRVWNYGNVPMTFDVEFRIGTYRATRNVSLIPRGAQHIAAPTLYTALPGIWLCRVSAVVPGDLHPEDNVKADTFTVRGTITKDVDARAVLAPTGVVDTSQTIMPRGRFGNNGVNVALFWTFFSILDSGGTKLYAESLQTTVGPGDSTDLEYPAVSFAVTGNYTAACSVALDGDQNSTNDTKLDTFQVAVAGMEENQRPTAYRSQHAATIIRGVLVLAEATSHKPQASSWLLDATGRKVLALKPGANDVSQLPSGVYFVRAVSRKLSAASCQKVVIQR